MDWSKDQVRYVYIKSKETKNAFLLGIAVSLTRSKSCTEPSHCWYRTAVKEELVDLHLAFSKVGNTFRPLEILSYSLLKITMFHMQSVISCLQGWQMQKYCNSLWKQLELKHAPNGVLLRQYHSPKTGWEDGRAAAIHITKRLTMSYNQNL